ncbi:MAG: tyrosine-type recombinase/integrase [Caulobacter sp.]|nr:tyrosine-type recombinase/integrase [Caulobacter sp.]
MSLTAVGVRNAKPQAKPYKMADSGGLYLLVTPKGSRLWRVDYRFDGKRKTLALGSGAEVTLVEARNLRDDARKRLREGQDPCELKAREKRKVDETARAQFRSVAARWFEARKSRWVAGYAERVWRRIEDDTFGAFGDAAIDDVTSDDVLAALRAIEARGAVETARRVGNYLQDIFRFAKAERLVTSNPAADLAPALSTRPPPKRRASLKARDLPDFLVALEGYSGDLQTQLALKLTLLTFVRTSETRFAAWCEFEGLDGAEPLWRIPAERMKMRTEHVVPLSKQAVAVLKDLRAGWPADDLLFPAATTTGAISENTMIYALYRMGYHSRATVHGFRSTASTILNEHGFNRDWVERQLAHAERDEVRAAYNAAEWLPQRRKMMGWWADYLDAARTMERAPRAPMDFIVA